jgi:hypothetical protein
LLRQQQIDATEALITTSGAETDLSPEASLQHPTPHSLPGIHVFHEFQDSVAEVLSSIEPVTLRTLELWMMIHGIVSLRLALPLFEWPPAEILVNDSIRLVLDK